MAALRAQGETLDAIAGRFGVSRERVRQILSAQGGPDRYAAAAARRRQAQRLANERVDVLLGLWRAGADDRTLAGESGLGVAACRSTIAQFATAADRHARQANKASARDPRTYSDRDIILVLRTVAASLGRVPSAKEYGGLARATELPSLATVLNRMGGWTTAVNAAGLRPSALAADRPSRRRWTDDACWDALQLAADELGTIPSVLAYERFAAGRYDLPSAATIRNRLGRWSSLAARLAAHRELTQHLRARGRAVELVLGRP
jgi:hypothetical protein